MKSFLQIPIVLLVIAVFIGTGCQPEETGIPLKELKLKDYSAEAPLEWNELFLELERYAPGYRPGPAPRALAYLNLAAYEAAASAMEDYQSLESVYEASGLDIPDAAFDELYHWPTVVNAAYADMMKEFFFDLPAELRFRIFDLESRLNQRYLREIPGEVYDRSKAHGQAVAAAVFDWSATDEYGHNAFLNPRPSNYTPPVFPGSWQPTFPDYGRAMFPYWGQARTFAIGEAEKLALPPLAFSETPGTPLYQEALEVYQKNTPELTYEDQWIAEFWSDDELGKTFSPPSRWIAIANQVVEAEGIDLEKALYAYAKVGLALNDAGVACWYSKYYYNVERPTSYIRRVIDPNWTPHLSFTPAFPAYPSGHSTFGAAAAEALSSIFGENYAMTDRCHEGRTEFIGTPRSFGSFREMAEENAYSRIPLGVHFSMDAVEGVRHGYEIGKKVNQLPFLK